MFLGVQVSGQHQRLAVSGAQSSWSISPGELVTSLGSASQVERRAGQTETGLADAAVGSAPRVAADRVDAVRLDAHLLLVDEVFDVGPVRSVAHEHLVALTREIRRRLDQPVAVSVCTAGLGRRVLGVLLQRGRSLNPPIN